MQSVQSFPGSTGYLICIQILRRKTDTAGRWNCRHSTDFIVRIIVAVFFQSWSGSVERKQNMKLSESKMGDQLTVNRMELPQSTMMRLKSLGMTNGTVVRILNRKKSGSVILSVRGTRLALGTRICDAIEVGRIH